MQIAKYSGRYCIFGTFVSLIYCTIVIVTKINTLDIRMLCFREPNKTSQQQNQLI